MVLQLNRMKQFINNNRLILEHSITNWLILEHFGHKCESPNVLLEIYDMIYYTVGQKNRGSKVQLAS